MASTFTPNLRLNKQGVGDNVGLWGGVVNTQLDLIEDAIGSNVSVALVAGNNTLTPADGAVDNARYMSLTFSGNLAAAASVIAPDAEKMFILRNNTSGGQTITFKNSAGTGLALVSGGSYIVYCDGTSVRQLSPAFVDGAPVFTTVSAQVGNFGSLGVLTTVSASVGIFNAGVSTSSLTANLCTFTSITLNGSLNALTGNVNTQVVNASARVSTFQVQATALVSTSVINLTGHASVGSEVRVPSGVVSASGGNFTSLSVSNFTLKGSSFGFAVVNHAYATSFTSATLSSLIPTDGTVPLNSEGTQITSLVITPKNANNLLRIRANSTQFHNATNTMTLALIIGASSAATKAAGIAAQNTYLSNLTVECFVTAGTTSPVTVAVRGGPNSGTVVINNDYYGGTNGTTLTVDEITSV